MDKKQLRIIYMGTPEFAVLPLQKLVENGYNIVAVITMSDKPSGRGHKMQQSAVKQYALSVGLPVLQPEKLKNPEFLEQLRSYNADLQIVVAFRMLPEVVWAMPKYGTFNLHASLLPQYRGAAPINWAIINGEKETGLTTFFLQQEIDTGDIIMQHKITIEPTDNAGTLHDKLMIEGAEMVIATTDMVINQNITAIPQNQIATEQLHTAPKIFKETCQINYDQTAEQIHNFVRGLSPYPAAWTEFQLNGHNINAKIFATEPIIEPHNLTIGTALTDNKTYIKIACKDGFIKLLNMQLPSKKPLNVRDVLNGLK